jgi:hypothetical protein
MQRSIVLILSVILGLLAGAARAQAPLVSIDPANTYVPHNTIITLAVRVSAETTSLMGYNIAVVFDPGVLQLQSVDEGGLPLGSGFETFFRVLNPADPDSVHVNGAILGNTVDGPGTLFTLTFRAWAPSTTRTTQVVIASSVLRNGVNENITHTVQNGTVIVETPIAVRSATWGTVKSFYRE